MLFRGLMSMLCFTATDHANIAYTVDAVGFVINYVWKSCTGAAPTISNALIVELHDNLQSFEDDIGSSKADRLLRMLPRLLMPLFTSGRQLSLSLSRIKETVSFRRSDSAYS